MKYAEVHFLPNYAVFWMGDPHYSNTQSPPTMFMYYWLIRLGDRNILVDTGVGPELARERKMVDYKPADLMLKKVGLSPSDIDTIILTHSHWDHLDGIDQFPQATVYLQRACYRFTVEEAPEFDFFRRVGYPLRRDSFSLLGLLWDGRLRILDGDGDILPGISVRQIDGHYPGLQIVIVETKRGRIVLANDAMHLRENLERDFPMGLYFGSLLEIVRGYRTIRALGGTVVPGHDPADFNRFTPLEADVLQIYP
jgi:glyoxylase-like metal-dependent hydrolase (beta-lactamase superfamily II)